MKYGTLYGIGVGPGDPDLLTLKAAQILSGIDMIFAASSSKSDFSIALGIVKKHLPKNAVIRQLAFPMSQDEKERQLAVAENIKQITAALEQGLNAAFISLGDALIYSTFGYILTGIKQYCPQIQVEVVPGITSFQAAAAKTTTILCENNQNLLIIPGIRNKTELQQDLKLADNAVILKAYHNLEDIKNTLREAQEPNNLENPVFVSRLGLDKELVCNNLDDTPEKPNYLSLILATKKRG
jgi:precorrin-2/cobalt-factor-2 C20-methyltransferase